MTLCPSSLQSTLMVMTYDSRLAVYKGLLRCIESRVQIMIKYSSIKRLQWRQEITKITQTVRQIVKRMLPLLKCPRWLLSNVDTTVLQ